jgi:hypothetical protein
VLDGNILEGLDDFWKEGIGDLGDNQAKNSRLARDERACVLG